MTDDQPAEAAAPIKRTRKARKIVRRRVARTPKGESMPFQKKTAGASASLLAELAGWASAHAQTPYEQLAERFARDGWMTRLVELNAIPTYSGTTLIVFGLQVGKSIETLELFDQLTVAIAPGPGPVSAAARMAARETVIFLLSGRLPPPKEAAPAAPTRTVVMDDKDVRLAEMPNSFKNVEPDTSNDEPEQEYLPADEVAETRVNVIERREPDGLPIFRDLYEIGMPEVQNTGEIIAAVLEEVEAFLASAVSEEQVTALGAKNTDMMTFFVDVGDKEDVDALKAAVNKRRNELQRPPGAVPRRRTAAAPRAN